MRAFLFLMLGAGLVYLGLTGKADSTLKATFGKRNSGGGAHFS